MRKNLIYDIIVIFITSTTLAFLLMWNASKAMRRAIGPIAPIIGFSHQEERRNF